MGVTKTELKAGGEREGGQIMGPRDINLMRDGSQEWRWRCRRGGQVISSLSMDEVELLIKRKEIG